MKNKLLIITALLLFVAKPIFSQIDSKVLEKWEGRKYSMFIHWGIYSQLGGVWDGRNISRGVSEQIQAHAGIYSDDYSRIAEQFNPTKWNAEDVVLLAKKAGMKSIVFTSKHHDGFCMFSTKTTKFNIVDDTPYGKDVLKELSEACAKHGIKFGLYFSNIDWHYPGASPISGSNSDLIPDKHFQLNKDQIEELLTNYGEVSELWFDMGSYTLKQSQEMKAWVHKLQPNCLVGSRIGNGQGDFMVMGDNQEPDYIIGVPWQSPAAFFHDTWGYRSWQDRGNEADKYREKLTSLINVCSRGGNFLLNIGPRGDGSIVEFEKNILLQIGKWLAKNGEAIYGTKADPFHKKFDWGAVTCKTNNIYLHVLNMPADRKILLPEFAGKIKNVTVLGEKISCGYVKTKDGVEITLPKSVNVDLVNVINLSLKDGFTTAPLNIITLDATTKLDRHNAFNYHSQNGVDYSTNYVTTVKHGWTLLADRPMKITPVLQFTDQEKNKKIELELGNKTTTLVLTGDNQEQLPNDIKAINWGTIYKQTPHQAWGFGDTHGNVREVDTSKSKSWAGGTWIESGFENNKLYTIKSRMSKADYITQEINSPVEQSVLIAITSGDGVLIALNGDVLAENGNIEADKSVRDIVRLDLKKGKNILFIKLFTRYPKEFKFGIDYSIPQVVYKKELPEIELKKGEYLPVSWKVDNTISIHESMKTTNMNLNFQIK